MSEKRISVFVDGANFFFMQRDALRWFVDPKRLLNWVAKRGEIVDAAYYLSVDPLHEGTMNFMRALTYIGFSIHKKEIQPTLEDWRNKANLDVELAVDMVLSTQRFDEAILVSGDGDFAYPLRVIKSQGKQVFVMSTAGFMSFELRQVAGMHFQDFAEIRSEVERADGRVPNSQKSELVECKGNF